MRWIVRWPLGTHREAGAHALVIHLSRRVVLDLHSWMRRRGEKKQLSRWTQQGTDGVVVVVMMVVVVIDQDGGHGHPYAVGSNAGQAIGLASCSWPWKVKYRKWDIWNDAAVGQGIEDVSY